MMVIILIKIMIAIIQQKWQHQHLKKKKKGKITQRTNTCLCKPSSEKFKTLPYFNLMMCMVLLWYDIDFTGLFVNGKRLQIFQPHVSLT